MAEMTPCPKNENHSSPQDCASCPRGCQWALARRRAVYTLGMCLQFISAAGSTGLRTSGAAVWAPQGRALYLRHQTPVSSLTHSFIHSCTPAFPHSSFEGLPGIVQGPGETEVNKTVS